MKFKMEKSVYFCTSFKLQLHYNIYSETSSITIKDETSLFELLLKHAIQSFSGYIFSDSLLVTLEYIYMI